MAFGPCRSRLAKSSPDGELQAAEKVEVQEALAPAGVLGAELLSLMPQHFPCEPAKRCFWAMAANQGFFDALKLAERRFFLPKDTLCLLAWRQST